MKVARPVLKERCSLVTGTSTLTIKWEELVQDLWGTEYCLASCKGCKHLVGEVASCTYMVCAMHPYGQKDCDDREEKYQLPKAKNR